VIRTHTRQQDIEFRSNNYRQDAPIDSVPAKLGAAVQQRGRDVSGEGHLTVNFPPP
jgi:hypothetical protein